MGYIFAEKEVKRCGRVTRGYIKDFILLEKWHCIYGDFHIGILGPIACRIAECYRRPTVVISYEGEAVARSINGDKTSVAKVIHQYGGSLKRYDIHSTMAKFCLYPHPSEQRIHEFYCALEFMLPRQPQISTDKTYNRCLSLLEVSSYLFDDFQALEPFGIGNVKPIFYSEGLCISNFRTFGKQENHLEFTFLGRKGYSYFQDNHACSISLHHPVDILYTLHDYREKAFLLTSFRQDVHKTIPFRA
ncbi:hypothetical protein [Bacillus panaciterrae]|uniref:hypothetical protein n=1 Tax=Ectobacillus panaciterrae TaxID=363872 RepID=UPI000418AD13